MEPAPPTIGAVCSAGPPRPRVPAGEWYLRLFDASQPDLNWANGGVRAEFREIIRCWLGRGASGFRVDVANALDKDPLYPDVSSEQDHMIIAAEGVDHPFWDRDFLHDVVREWRSVVDEYPGAMLIAEAWVSSWERLALYL